jgi:hypothetical protein
VAALPASLPAVGVRARDREANRAPVIPAQDASPPGLAVLPEAPVTLPAGTVTAGHTFYMEELGVKADLVIRRLDQL